MEGDPLTALLAHAQRRLGVAHQQFGIAPVPREKRDPALGRDAHFGTIERVRERKTLLQYGFDSPRGLRAPPNRVEDDREFVTPGAREVRRFRMRPQPGGDLAQERVACMAAERIVDRAQALEVHDHERQLPVCRCGNLYVLRHALLKQGAVAQPGESVVEGEVVDPACLLEVVERKRNVSGQFLQEPYFPVIEKSRDALRKAQTRP